GVGFGGGINRRKPRLAAHQSAPQVSVRPPTIGDAMPDLAGWDSFYVIIGSSAAALTGLMFVVIALTGAVSATVDAVRAFRPPTVAYAGAVAGAAGLGWRPAPGLVLVGAAALFLLYIGIHNAWDAAIYVSVARRARRDPSTPPK